MKKFINKVLQDFEAKKSDYYINAPYPKKIMIELTNICNAKCKFCSNRVAKRKKEFMKFELYKKVIDEAVTLGIKEYALFTTGESFLHPEIFKFIKYVKQNRGTYVYLTTNGICLDKIKMKKILESQLDSIKFSIDAGFNSTYKYLKGIKNFSLEELKKNIRYLCRLREQKKSKLKIYGSYVVSSINDTKKEISQFNKEFIPFLDDVFYNIANFNGLKLLKKEENIINKIFLNKYFKGLKLIRKNCNFLWERFIVQCNGDLTICCLDYNNELVYGNVKDSTLRSCWNNNIMKTYRKEMLEKKFKHLKICAKCNATIGYKNEINILKDINENLRKL